MTGLPHFQPWNDRHPPYLQPVPDAGRVTVQPDPGPPVPSPADASRAVTDPSPEPATDPSPSPSLTGDGDTDSGPGDFDEFGQKIGWHLAAWFGLCRTAGVTGTVTWNALKDRDAWARNPDSVSAHIHWIHDKSWIPQGHEGSGPIVLLRVLRFGYGYTLGLAATLAGNGLIWLRVPQHLIAFAIAVALLDLIVIH